MKNEEAIARIRNHKIAHKMNEPRAIYISEALDMAVKALEQEPCEDCISRETVDELSKELVHTTRDKADFLCKFWEGLQKLPPVTPQQPMSRWINVDETHSKCDRCGAIFEIVSGNGEANYCPNCGAKMQEVEE